MREFGITGRSVEAELFGEVNKNKYRENYPFKEGENTLFRSHEEFINIHLELEKARRIVRLSQPDGMKPFAFDLRQKVAEELKNRGRIQDQSELKFYTSVRSHADRFHNIDAWLEIETNEQPIITEMDATINPQKMENKYEEIYVAKKNVITFLVPEDGLDKNIDAEEYAKKLELVSQFTILDLANKIDDYKKIKNERSSYEQSRGRRQISKTDLRKYKF